MSTIVGKLKDKDGNDFYPQTDAALVGGLANVATSGSYDDLANKPTIPDDLNDLTDTAISSPSNGQVLTYDSSASKWTNAAPKEGLFVCNMTNFGSTYSCDKTWEEIYAAYQDGKLPILVYNYDIYQCSNISDTSGAFSLSMAISYLSFQSTTIAMFYYDGTGELFPSGWSSHSINSVPFSASNKTKLDGIATGAEVNVQSDWSQTDTTADDYIKNKPDIVQTFQTGEQVNAVSIINDLTTGGSTDVLSAEQGEILAALMADEAFVYEMQDIQPTSEEVGILNNITGAVNTDYSQWLTSKYDISGQKIIKILAHSASSASFCGCAFYDSSDNVLTTLFSGLGKTLQQCVFVPANAKYVRLTCFIESLTGTQYTSCKSIDFDNINWAAIKSAIVTDLPPYLRLLNSTKDFDIESGTISTSTGQNATSSTIIRTGYIAASSSIEIDCNSNYSYTVFQYASDKSLVTYQSFNGLKRKRLKPTTAYIRLIFYKTGETVTTDDFEDIQLTLDGKLQVATDWTPVSKEYVDDLLPVDVSSKFLLNKKVVFLGDSITQGGQGSGDEKVTTEKVYHKIFANITGCNNVNLGAAATCIASNNTSDAPTPFVNRVTQANFGDADYIVVWGGLNDFSYDSKAIGSVFTEETITAHDNTGSKRLVPTTDTDTFDGALHNLIETIRTYNSTAPIVFMTPLNRRASSSNPSSAETNKFDEYIDDFRDTIKEVCQFYSIPVFDIGRNSVLDVLNDDIKTAYFVDNLHPNASGHRIIGRLLANWFRANMYYD